MTRFKLSLIAFALCGGTFGFSYYMTVRTIHFEGLDGLARMLGASAPFSSRVDQSEDCFRLLLFSGFFGALALYWVLYELADKFDKRGLK